jgi:hypothetical protein
MTRRTVLWSPLLLKLRQAWSNGSTRSTASANGEAPRQAPIDQSSVTLKSSNHTLEFDRKTARLLSLRATVAPEQEFAVSNEAVPVFVIQHLTEAREFRQISSFEARHVDVDTTGATLRAVFSSVGGLDLTATVTIRMDEQSPQSRWSISIRNHAGLTITDIQFPFIVASYQLGGTQRSEAILHPLTTGRLVQAPTPLDLEPDSPHAWQFRPENFDTRHYPGLIFAQFLAYYTVQAFTSLARTRVAPSS